MTTPTQDLLKCLYHKHPCANCLQPIIKKLTVALAERDEARKHIEKVQIIMQEEINTKDTELFEVSNELESQSALIEKLKEGMGELVKVLKSADTHVLDNYRLLKKQIKEALDLARKVGM